MKWLDREDRVTDDAWHFFYGLRHISYVWFCAQPSGVVDSWVRDYPMGRLVYYNIHFSSPLCYSLLFKNIASPLCFYKVPIVLKKRLRSL